MSVANPNQTDTDGDSTGDACEADGDSDGLGDASDSNSYAPAVNTAAADATGNEGALLGTSGAFSDQDGNNTLTITGTGVVDNGDGTWSWSLLTTDDVSGSVTVTASDGEHTSATDTFNCSASDVAPALSNLTLTGNSGTACTAGNTVGLDFTFTGASVDTFTGSIN